MYTERESVLYRLIKRLGKLFLNIQKVLKLEEILAENFRVKVYVNLNSSVKYNI